jgi:putative MATE family efflux protein
VSAIDLSPDTASNSSAQHPAMNQRRVLTLALPIMGENLLQTTVGVVDTLLVSRLGDDAIAGVGVGAEITFFTLAILSAVSIGATVLVSQAVGAGDRDRANRFARQAISWGLTIAVPLSLLLFLLAPTIIGLFGTESDVRHLAIDYFEVIGATSAALLLSYLCGAVLRGAGDAKTPLKAALLANIVNIVAAYGLIFGHFGLPELGVAGSAWGATIGRSVSALYMLRALWKGRTPVSIHGRAGWLPKRHFGIDLFRLGIPAAIEQMMIQGGTTVLVVIVATIGSEALTAQQINFTVMSLALLPGMSLAMATTALVGQSVGARAIDDAEKAAIIGRRLSTGWMIFAATVVVILARHVVGIFSDDPDVLDIGTRGLRALAITLPFWGLWVITAGTLRGSGDTRGPMYRGGMTIWTSVALAFIGVHFFDLGIGWVWSTFLISAPISWIGNVFAFKRRLVVLRRESAALAHQP